MKRKRVSTTEKVKESTKNKNITVTEEAEKKKRLISKVPKFDGKRPTGKRNKPGTKRERKLHSKELAEAKKKKRKRHYALEHELTHLWEKMRQRNLQKETRSKLISQALQKMEGKIPQIAGYHVSSRILQTCIKHCTQSERDAVFDELRPHFLALACKPYSVHLVKKLLDTASKKQLADFISSIRGKVSSFLRNRVGSTVVDHVYQLGNASQRQELLMELYSPELQLFGDLASINDSSFKLIDVISKLGLVKASVSRHMNSVIQPILENEIVDYAIIHKLLMEYFSIADKSSAEEIIQQLAGPLLIRMIHTRDGSRIGILCVKHGTAKERKRIVKAMKGYVGKVAKDQHGSLSLAYILSAVDDTKLVKKVIIKELLAILEELVFDKNGRRPLLQLLNPNSRSYSSSDDIITLTLSSLIPSLSTVDVSAEKSDAAIVATQTSDGKKDPYVRTRELLIESGLAEKLIELCTMKAGELLRSNFGKDVIYEVAAGGPAGVIHQNMPEKLGTLHVAVAHLAAETKPYKESTGHILENFHSSRTIRKLVLECPAFASTLWSLALKGKSSLWAEGHSSKVLRAYLESSDANTRALADEELRSKVQLETLATQKKPTKMLEAV